MAPIVLGFHQNSSSTKLLRLFFKFSEFAEYLFSLRFSRRFSITQMANMAVLCCATAAAAATKAQTSENDGLAFTVMKKQKKKKKL